MPLDVLVLNSGEWLLNIEVRAVPWHILIYKQRGEPLNELHVWLPRESDTRAGDFAFKRFWKFESTRWCVEAAPEQRHLRHVDGLRFSSPQGRVLWATPPRLTGLGDLTDAELRSMLISASEGPYARS